MKQTELEIAAMNFDIKSSDEKDNIFCLKFYIYIILTLKSERVYFMKNVTPPLNVCHLVHLLQTLQTENLQEKHRIYKKIKNSSGYFEVDSLGETFIFTRSKSDKSAKHENFSCFEKQFSRRLLLSQHVS